MRHSAARPNRLPAIRIKPARRQRFSNDWKIKSAADADALDPDDVDAWIRETAANENDGLKRSGLWQYLFPDWPHLNRRRTRIQV